jgi:uncharacterized membrane protein
MNKVKIRLVVTGADGEERVFVIGSFIKPDNQEKWTKAQVDAVIENVADRVRNRLINLLERLYT